MLPVEWKGAFFDYASGTLRLAARAARVTGTTNGNGGEEPPAADIGATPRAPQPTLWEVGSVLLRLGVVAYGGLGAALVLLTRELVEKRRWLREQDVTDALAFTKPLPGSTVVQMVAFLGWRLCGWAGGVVAASAFVAPAAVLMTAAAAGLAAVPDAPWLQGALTGIQVAVVGLLTSALWRLARSEAAGRALTAVLLVAGAAGFVMNAALVVVAAGVLGVVLGRGATGTDVPSAKKGSRA